MRFTVMLCTALAAPLVAAGEADVVDARIERTVSGTYVVNVTVRHDDTGWEHYADKWDVVTPDGSVLGTRVLHHPHVGEQPFTRSLSGLRIPDGTGSVLLRAHDKVHGYGGKVLRRELR